MSRVYFDITDIIQFAARNTRLTGIQRVVFNIVNILSRKHGGELVRCVYYDRARDAMFEVDLSRRTVDAEFDAEALLVDLGIARQPGFFPTAVRVKSYLRNHARSKLHRILLKWRIHAWSLFARSQLRELDLLPVRRPAITRAAIAPSRLERLPVDSPLVHLGSSWFFPEVWRFSAEHCARGGDVVQYIHDLIPVTHPEFMPDKEPPVFINWLNQAMDYAARFRCNSQWTARSLEGYASSRGRRLSIGVTTLAHEFISFGRDADVELPMRLASLRGQRIVLCVGTFEARKNGVTLMRAWRQLVPGSAGPSPILVFAGRYGKIGGAAFRDELNARGTVSGHIRVIDMPSDQELAWLYRNCIFTVYPSMVEGWGLPVGESVWFGKYCIASSASSIPEVCGDLIDYVDPLDTGGLRTALAKALGDEEFLRSREREIAAAELRTWTHVADDLYACVKR